MDATLMKEEQKKTININASTHERLVLFTRKRNLVLYKYADEVVNTALDLAEHSERRRL